MYLEPELTTSIFLNPDCTRHFNTSHPIPPAPTNKTLELAIADRDSEGKTPAIFALLCRNPETKKKKKIMHLDEIQVTLDV